MVHLENPSSPVTDIPPNRQATARSSPVDWNAVPFEVTCARCGQNLRGLSDPVCPKCRLEFDWAEAVPIEELTCAQCGYHLYGLTGHRCPECGTTFTWEDALADYHRRRNSLFEYQWRRRPIRSLIRTWFRVLLPGRFWRSLDMHHPPRVGPLLVIVGVSLILLLLICGPIIALTSWIVDWIDAARGNWIRPDWQDLQMYVLDILQAIPVTGSVVVLWFLVSFASLHVFRQSMRLFRIRGGQVFRVWVYAVAITLPLVFALAGSCIVLVSSYETQLEDWSVALAFLSYLFWVTWSIRQGYRHYLRMPHALGVAVTAMVIAFSGWACVTSLIAIALEG